VADDVGVVTGRRAREVRTQALVFDSDDGLDRAGLGDRGWRGCSFPRHRARHRRSMAGGWACPSAGVTQVGKMMRALPAIADVVVVVAEPCPPASRAAW
jgi:hypothetical protein